MSETNEALLDIDRLLADAHQSLEDVRARIEEAAGPLLPGKMGDDVEIALQDVLSALYKARDVLDGYIDYGEG